MPSAFSVFEIIIYSLLNFLPFIVFAIYPFRRRLRFSKRTTIMLIVLVAFVQIGLGTTARFYTENKALLSVISTLIYGGFYLLTVKANLGKMLFTLLMLSNIANLVVISSKCFEGLIFPEFARQTYRLTYSAVVSVMLLIILVPLFFYMKKNYTAVVEQDINNYHWRYLWLIPATFYLLWYHSCYYNTKSALEIALLPSNTFFLFVINLGAFLVYWVVIKMVSENAKNLELEMKNHQLAMQSLQYKNLSDCVAEARRAKHDMHHHLTIMSAYVDNGEYEKLKEYLFSFMRTIPEDSSIVYCEHYALNMLILYFAQLSKDNEIDFSANVSVPSEISISDSDLSVLLGNLLENALDACIAQKNTKRRIVLNGRVEKSCLIFAIDNTCENDVKKNQDGIYLSTKHSGTGIGIESVKTIAERHHGIVRTELKDGVFCVSAMLNL